MAAKYYRVHTEDGYCSDDPCPEAIAVLIGELNHVDNTFMTIRPADENRNWRVSVLLRDDDTYEIRYRDAELGDHRSIAHADPGAVVGELTRWLAVRDYPVHPAAGSGLEL